MIHIFTDGASRGNPGPGGWGAVIVQASFVAELGGREDVTTNNRMELSAVCGALEFLKTHERDSITIYTDSKYVLNGSTKWLKGWKQSEWTTKAKTPVLNVDLWKRLDTLSSYHDISWELLPGHSGIIGNERADHIATAYADKKDIKLYNGPRDTYPLDILSLKRNELREHVKNDKKARNNTKAYSYLSLVDGILMRHRDWASCEKRVKGKKAKFKKAISFHDEQNIVQDWGYKYTDIKDSPF